MKIKFWGCRGSIPVPDSRMVKYGGNTACVEVGLDEHTLIIDAGTGIRKLGEKLVQNKVTDMDIFITHSHWDHIQGFPFFEPIYSDKTTINIFGCTNSYKQLKSIFEGQMSQEYFPVSFSDLKSKINFLDACGKQYELHGSIIKVIRTNHPIFTIGLRVEKDGKSFVFITDNEIMAVKQETSENEFVKFCEGADYLIHDTQFSDEEYKKRKGWGHSTYEQAIKLANDAKVKNLGFFHHDPNRKDADLDAIEAKYRNACKDRKYEFGVFAVKELDEIKL
ncbi:MAG: hypothetical protein A3J83_04900 [Elusimicrobia bacterium RIFOXYA2_FULL_40_6]|nr:MAG: hypothetical protein A3J83_04900 [Elusimicrobia bacterium RIFOXYA2_FULL_40_6]